MIFSYFIYIIVNYKWKTLIIFLFLTIGIINSFDFNKVNDNYNHKVKVTKTYKNSLIVKEDNVKYYVMNSSDQDFVEGDLISFSGYYAPIKENDSFSLFLRSNNVSGYAYGYNFDIIEKSNSYRSRFKQDLIDNPSHFSNYSLSILYGYETKENQYIFEQIQNMGISHLFVISGLHISILFMIIKNFIFTLTKNKRLSFIVGISVSFIFLFMIYMPLTGLRALLTILILKTNRFNKIDSLSITGIIFYLMNPWMMISSSMILSFGITYMIYIINPSKHSFIDSILLSICAFYVALPTISTWTNKHNIFAPLLSIVLTPLTTFSYIACLVLTPFNSLWFIGDWIFLLINLICNIFSVFTFNIYLNTINITMQFILISLTILYIYKMRMNKYILLNTFSLLSIILIII